MIKLIRTEKAYHAALNRLYHLMQSALIVNSDEYKECQLLNWLVLEFEETFL